MIALGYEDVFDHSALGLGPLLCPQTCKINPLGKDPSPTLRHPTVSSLRIQNPRRVNATAGSVP